MCQFALLMKISLCPHTVMEQQKAYSISSQQTSECSNESIEDETFVGGDKYESQVSLPRSPIEFCVAACLASRTTVTMSRCRVMLLCRLA